MSSLGLFWFGGNPFSFTGVVVTSGAIAIFGMSACLIGAGIGRWPDLELSAATLTDRNWIGALLLCVGGALGLAGSQGSWFFPFGILGVTSFSLILLFGVRLFRKGPERRLFSSLTIYFAFVGVVDMVFLVPWLFLFASAAVWPFYFRFLGAAVAVSGAILLLLRPSR